MDDELEWDHAKRNWQIRGRHAKISVFCIQARALSEGFRMNPNKV